uniref:Cadherin domain-containing protein n=1 Tax=Electrophorus electricus TaxID=8005 RepID=A0AAY5EWV6_ELEEL
FEVALLGRQVLLFISLFSLTPVHGQVSYSVPEERPKGSLVGDIAQDLGLDVKRLKSGKARIYTADSAEYIELNREKGLLLIKEKMDREVLCGQTTPCTLHFQIILENPLEFFSVTIEVTDINDNPPHFSKDEMKFEISESALSGARFVLERAVDEDVGTNGLQSYTLKPTDNFVLKLHSLSAGSKNVEMVLQKPLDREKHDHITLLLTAVDGGEPKMSGTMQIRINVLDANDNAPVCLEPVYKTSVTEHSPKGTTLTAISAVDADEGPNGLITYILSNNVGTANIFAINNKDGVLRVNGDIDFEKVKSYEIDVVATDQGGHFDTCKVIVDVIDKNDNCPSINVMSKSSEIFENAKIGTVTAIINVQDIDSGENGRVQCTINESVPFTLKSTSSNFFSLVTDAYLDRERDSAYNISVSCADEGEPSLSASVILSLQISDVNDNAPVFEQTSYEASVIENNTPGLSIFTVKARDADWNQNARVSYILEDSLVNGMPITSYVSISPDTGVINAIRSFDYEQIKDFRFRVKAGFLDFEKSKKYELYVEATDRGGLTDTSKVIIEITDVNDNAPVISLISFSNPIAEDSPPETMIAMLNIKDLDSGRNGQIKCTVDSNLPFKIKSSSPNIYTLVTEQLLDREKVSGYNITVIASDEGSPAFSANKTLTLKVSDVNDNAPVFQRKSYAAYVLENNSPGVSIFAVTATDKDSGNNARISYFLEDITISGVSASNYVSVNSDNGEIRAVYCFDYEQTKEFYIRIKAQDGGNPPLSGNVTVKIIIKDQNDNGPQILYPVQTGGALMAEIVPRSADVGYLVTKVVAVDVDSGQNAWLSYKLQKATDRALFEVGLQNGEIRTVRQVTDKDAVKQKLTVVVEDNGQPSRSATVNINVAVADSFPEVLSEFTDFTHDKEYNDNLTFYLVLALAVVSFLFLISIIAIISVKCYRWRRERMFYKSGVNLPVIPYYPPLYADVGGTGTLQHVYNYEVCRTTDSTSDLKCARPSSESILHLDTGGTETLTYAQREKMIYGESDNRVSYVAKKLML